jgi:hypothetical protein
MIKRKADQIDNNGPSGTFHFDDFVHVLGQQSSYNLIGPSLDSNNPSADSPASNKKTKKKPLPELSTDAQGNLKIKLDEKQSKCKLPHPHVYTATCLL